MKLVFFDVDGTLSAPQYPVDGELQVGMSDERWIRYCEEYGEDTYQYCRPVPMVKRYAQKRKAEGAALYVLTTCQGEAELHAKEKFVKRHYDGLFERVIPVRRDADKLTVIRQMALEQGRILQECEIVDDTYAILLHACVSGVKATHVANIASEEV